MEEIKGIECWFAQFNSKYTALFDNTKKSSFCFVTFVEYFINDVNKRPKTGFKAFITTLALEVTSLFILLWLHLTLKYQNEVLTLSLFPSFFFDRAVEKLDLCSSAPDSFDTDFLSHKQRGRKKVFHLESSYVWSCLLCVGGWQLRLT